MQKVQISHFFNLVLSKKKNKGKKISLLSFFYLRRLVFDKSSPVEPVSDSVGGYLEHDKGEGGEGQTFLYLIVHTSPGLPNP